MDSCCAINEILLIVMGERIKAECAKLYQAGATTEQINETLAEHIIPTYEVWRRMMLEQAMAEIEGMTPPADDLSPLTPLRRN
jgi:hypothetical protein